MRDGQYCVGHARSMGLVDGNGWGGDGVKPAQDSIADVVRDLAEVSESAAASLDRQASSWLESRDVQRRLRRRWNQILDKGSDAEMIRLIKELSDRVYGRAAEHKERVEVSIPDTLIEIEAMSVEEQRQALAQLEAQGY